MGRVTSKGNEPESKMKQPSDVQHATARPWRRHHILVEQEVCQIASVKHVYLMLICLIYSKNSLHKYHGYTKYFQISEVPKMCPNLYINCGHHQNILHPKMTNNNFLGKTNVV